MKSKTHYDNGLERRGHSLEELKKYFPVGAEVEFLCDDGGETDSEWYEIGYITGYDDPMMFGNKSLGIFGVHVSNVNRSRSSHLGNTRLTLKEKRKRTLNKLK